MRIMFEKCSSLFHFCVKCFDTRCVGVEVLFFVADFNFTVMGRKSSSLEFKLKALDSLRQTGNISATAREHSVSRRVVQRWQDQEIEFRDLKQKKTKKRGDTLRRRCCLTSLEGRAVYADVEEELETWIKSQRQDGFGVHGKVTV